MARARTLKPSFFQNEDLAACGPFGMILFEGLWCHADREGRLEDRPVRLKVQVLPYFDCDCDELLSCLEKRGFIVRYEVEGSKYIQVLSFKKHQNPHVKEAASTIPAPDFNSAITGNSGTSPALTLLPITVSLNPSTATSSDARPQSDTKTVFQHWQQKLNHPHAKLTPERQRKITAALKNYSAASLCLAIDGCAVTPHNMGQNDRGEVYDDISLIVRDAVHIERFIRNAAAPPKANGAGHGKPSKLQIAAEAIRKSNPERYGTPAVVQDAGPQPRLCAISGGPPGGDPSDD